MVAYRGLWPVALAALVTTALSCSSHLIHGHLPSVIVSPAPFVHLDARSLARARHDLNVLPLPAGMDPAAFEQLRAALDRQLALRQTEKAASQLPNQQRNTVTDALVVDDGSGGFNLTWTYKNIGDYGQNGEVGISDLTPLGSNLGKTSSGPGWSSAQIADGDANGAITISDLTPIGANLGAQVSGYNIYGGNSASGPWGVLLGSVDLTDGSGTPKTFLFGLGSTPPPFILLSARDATGADWQGGIDPVPATIQLGNDIPDQATTVTANSGGTLTGSAGTPLQGYNVTIPSSSFDIDTQVSLGYNDGSITPNVGTQLGPIINLTTDYGAPFQDPVNITVPYSGNPDELPVPFYLNPDGGLQLCDIVDLNPAAHTMTFNTWHASSFAVILALANDPLADFYDTKYDPKRDGFRVPNNGSKYNKDGECIGMSAFSAWYFRNVKTPPLYNKYLDALPSLDEEMLTTGQDVIATRSYNSINRGWDVYEDVQRWQWTQLSHQQVWLCMRIALVNTAAPVLLGLKPADLSGGGHCVLAYAYVGDDMFIYDPNSPGESKTIHFDNSIKRFDDYGNYAKFAAVGDGSLAIREAFEDIHTEAENNFGGSADAKIVITTPDNDSLLTGNPIGISLGVESGQILADKLEMWSDGPHITYDIPSGHLLDLTKQIKNGDNYFNFRLSGLSARGNRINVPFGIFGNSTGHPISEQKGLHVFGQFAAPRKRYVLTWYPVTQGASPGTFVVCVKLVPNGGGGPYILDGHAGGGTAPDGITLAEVPPSESPDGSNPPGGTWILKIPDNVQDQGTYYWCVHRTDITGVPNGVGWRWTVYDGESTSGILLETGNQQFDGDSLNTPSWDEGSAPSPAWSFTEHGTY